MMTLEITREKDIDIRDFIRDFIETSEIALDFTEYNFTSEEPINPACLLVPMKELIEHFCSLITKNGTYVLALTLAELK